MRWPRVLRHLHRHLAPVHTPLNVGSKRARERGVPARSGGATTAWARGLEEGKADAYTRVTIDCFPGRTLDAKRHLYREIVERLEVLGIPRDGVSILLRESAVENWGAGGRAASDYDLGFEISV